MSNNVTPASGVVDVINAAQGLVEAVGPIWGIAILLVILVFFPKIGVLVHLAAMFKEDRADARKRKLEAERLEARYRNRAQTPKLPPPKPNRRKKEQV